MYSQNFISFNTSFWEIILHLITLQCLHFLTCQIININDKLYLYSA